jgi:ATP-dependent DNA helicase RecQ
VQAARRFFRGRDVVIEPRKLWVSGLPGRKGKIAGVARGPALAFADNPAWGDVCGCSGSGTRQHRQKCRTDWFSVLVALVGELGTAGRCSGHAVPAVPAPGRLPRRASGAERERAAADGRGASAVRARDLLARTSVRDGMSFDGPVLLVDDTIWTR